MLIYVFLLHHQLENDGAQVTVSSKKMFGFALETIKGLASSDANKALRLFLQGAQVLTHAQSAMLLYKPTFVFLNTAQAVS